MLRTKCLIIISIALTLCCHPVAPSSLFCHYTMAPSAKISYTGPPNFLASDQWIQILTALKAHLPLKNIVYTNGDTTRTIRELDVDFVPLDEVEEERSVVRGSIVDKPLVNLFAFACEVRIIVFVTPCPFHSSTMLFHFVSSPLMALCSSPAGQ